MQSWRLCMDIWLVLDTASHMLVMIAKESKICFLSLTMLGTAAAPLCNGFVIHCTHACYETRFHKRFNYRRPSHCWKPRMCCFQLCFSSIVISTYHNELFWNCQLQQSHRFYRRTHVFHVLLVIDSFYLCYADIALLLHCILTSTQQLYNMFHFLLFLFDLIMECW